MGRTGLHGVARYCQAHPHSSQAAFSGMWQAVR